MRMRFVLLLVSVLPLSTLACTAFKVTQDGRTLIGCNEDAWSINAQVRFEQGRDGGYGAIYFSHYNGSPLRAMMDQMGMNEAGLVFDGFSLGPGPVKRRAGLPWMETSDGVAHIMRTCVSVREVLDYLRTVDTGPTGGMFIFFDAKGDYLVMEPDTMFLGNDPWYAVGNWRMSSCTDPSTIPIPRLQAGRALLAGGIDASVESATTVLESMKACRSKLGEGTLFSTLFDPARGQAHLFFYHDFRERVTFDLKTELAKGDRTIEMTPLFGERPEYKALLAYGTPFHQRWLWWTVACAGALSLLGMLWAFGLFVLWVIACIRSRAFVRELPWLVIGVGSALATFLCGTLLMVEGVYYFGLGDAVDRIHPLLRWMPLGLLACTAWLFVHSFMRTRYRRLLRGLALVQGALITALAYWGLLWP